MSLISLKFDPDERKATLKYLTKKTDFESNSRNYLMVAKGNKSALLAEKKNLKKRRRRKVSMEHQAKRANLYVPRRIRTKIEENEEKFDKKERGDSRNNSCHRIYQQKKGWRKW